jgi:hypothetical protein
MAEVRRCSVLTFLLGFTCSLPTVASPNLSQVTKFSTPDRAAISRIIGRDRREYRAKPESDGSASFQLKSGLKATFKSEGLSLLTAGPSHWHLSFRAFGYGDSLRPARPALLQASHNRVEYRRGSLTEWYVNGPLGLEQGFTLSHAPSRPNGTALTIAMTLDPGIKAKLEKESHGVALTDDAGKQTLHYSGLAAYDSNHKELRAWIEVRGNELMLRADDRGATYPLVIDPWIEVAELTASDGTGYSFFGYSVALDGDSLLIGAPGDTVGSHNSQGAAYVFVKPKGGWSTTSKFTAKLTSSDGQSNDQFGVSVTISGNTVVVGATNQSIGRNQGQGAAYVYVKPKAGWRTTSRFIAKLTASDGAPEDSFGSVSLSGSTLLVGAYGATINGNQAQGAAYIFIEPKSGWRTTSKFAAKLTSSDGKANDLFGYAVCISSNTLIVGAYGAGASPNQGEAYVFVRPMGGWKDATESSILTASDGGQGDKFGNAVSVEGDTAVVGAFLAYIHGRQEQGAVYVFVKPNTGWMGSLTQTAKLTASNGQAGDNFGVSVSLSGKILAIGAWGVNRGRGAVYAFIKPQSGWRNTSKFSAELTASGGAQNDNFGVAACAKGSTIVSGASGVVVNNTSVGATYIFETGK